MPIILITGATKGIGKAIAELFSEKGYIILFTSRKKQNLKPLEKQFKQKGAKDSKGYILDIRNLEESKSLVLNIKKDYKGCIDLLVNNAGIGYFANTMDITPEVWQDVINTNLTGLFYLTQSILPLMIAREKGHIINIGSLASRNSFAGGSLYCASKFALLGFSECLMLDVRKHQIKVSIIMPGSVNTEFSHQAVVPDDETWKLTAKDVADAVYDVVNTSHGHLMSRVELRPLNPSS